MGSTQVRDANQAPDKKTTQDASEDVVSYYCRFRLRTPWYCRLTLSSRICFSIKKLIITDELIVETKVLIIQEIIIGAVIIFGAIIFRAPRINGAIIFGAV